MSVFPVRNLLLPGLVGLAMLAVTLAACGGDDPAKAPVAAAAPSAATASAALAESNMELTDLKGLIEIDGSSTVYPVTEAMAEVFGEMTDGNVRVVVGISGTGGGFKKFCGGETVISDASRPIQQSEIDLCADAGTDYVEIPVAIDGLSVLVNTKNDFVDCMTIDELHTVWAPEAEDVVTKWNQVRAGWPDEDLRLYAPGTDSGTFDYFTETVNGASQASRGDGIFSEDDNVLVTGISRDRGALGYFGYAYYEENRDILKIVGIDGGGGDCIIPTSETINNGTYSPLSRPLFIYVRADVLNEPHIKEFIKFYLDNASHNLISETGYIPFQDRVYELGLAKFQNGKTGAVFGGDAKLSGTVEEVLEASQ